MNLKAPLAFIIGDSQGCDSICRSFAYYNRDACHISHMCNATPNNYNNLHACSCELLVMDDIKALVEENKLELLNNLLQATHWLALYKIHYGGSPGRIFTAACPPEALHSLENGLIFHCLKEVSGEIITPIYQAMIDKVVQSFTTNSCQIFAKGYMKKYPRLIFYNGISTLSDTSAGTKVGMMFALVLAALTTDGQKVFLSSPKCNESQYVNMIYAFHLLICYWAWLKKDTFWFINDEPALKQAQDAISVMLKEIVNFFPRKSGSQWHIPKLHDQLHVAYNIQMFGSHKNIHTGPHEHNHIDNSKKPYTLTQKRRAVMDWQIAN